MIDGLITSALEELDGIDKPAVVAARKKLEEAQKELRRIMLEEEGYEVSDE